jgi:hypothetical protein
MAATLTLAQDYPIPGIVPVTFVAPPPAAAPVGDYVRVWVTSAPVGSTYRGYLDANTYIDRAMVFDGGVKATWDAVMDVGGKYTFTLQEYDFIATDFGGGYYRDPDSWPVETKQGAEFSESLYIGERLVHRLGAAEYGYADLILWVWNATIRKTTVQVHGETTPAIINPTTARAEAAAYSSTVETTMETFVDQTAAALLTNIATMITEMVLDIPNHMNNNGGAYHVAPDNDNQTEIKNLPNDPSTPAGYATAARVLVQRLLDHMSDRDNTWHTYPDYTNHLITPIPSSALDMPAIWAAIADVYRAYEAHRSFAGHGANDVTNNLATALDTLLTLHRDFLAALRPLTPVTPATANPATTTLAQWGFGRTDEQPADYDPYTIKDEVIS